MMRYRVQVFNETRTFCDATLKTDAQNAYERFCESYPEAHVVFTDRRRGVIAEQKPTQKTESEHSHSTT